MISILKHLFVLSSQQISRLLQMRYSISTMGLKIFVLDTRYYKKGPSAFAGEHPEITDILLLYNMNTLDADTGIGGIY